MDGKAVLDILHRYRRGEVRLAEDAARQIGALVVAEIRRHDDKCCNNCRCVALANLLKALGH